jgi:hypothetical protein
MLFAYGLKMGIWGIWMASLATQVIWFIAAAIICNYHLRKLGETSDAD